MLSSTISTIYGHRERERSDAGRRAGEYRYRRSGDDPRCRQELPDVIVVVDPADYERIGGMIASGGIPFAERRRLAAKAFQHVALYDTAISTYLRQDVRQSRKCHPN